MNPTLVKDYATLSSNLVLFPSTNLVPSEQEQEQGLKSYQVELVDFEYHLNEGESIKSSSPTKIEPNLRTYS
jgi:hypothetical protein